MSAFRVSLRLKLTLWFLLIFVVVFSGALAAAWLLHSSEAREMLDQRLLSRAQGISAELMDAVEMDASDGVIAFPPVERVFVLLAVRDERGEVIASRGQVDVSALPAIAGARKAPDTFITPLSGDIAFRLLGSDYVTRMVTYRHAPPGGPVRYLDLATTGDLREQQSAFLFDVLLVGGLGALLASALAAWMVAGRAVQPMRLIADAARDVDAQHLGQRIELGETEIEVQNLRTALNDALARLEEGYRAQSRFISNIAHDLKTPIAVMLTQSQVLRPGSLSEEELENYRTGIIVELQRLGGLVEGFLTLARAGQGEAFTRMVQVPIIDVVMEAISECDPEAELAQVRLVAMIDDSATGRGEFEIRGDPDLLRTMLVNLIRNAIRFTPVGQAVDVRIAQQDDRAVFVVRDRGPGIPDEFRRTIFEQFARSRFDPLPSSGLGLGLAITRTIVELHRGTIEVRNCEDMGCRFELRLPLAQSPAATAALAAAPRDNPASMSMFPPGAAADGA